jgi:hypothetical protein
LAGIVTDPTGGGVAGATVQAMDGSGAVVGSVTTLADGSYSLNFLPRGSLRLVVTAPGFKSTTIHGAASGGRQDVRLEIGSVSQSVTVSASLPSIQTESSSLGLASRRVRVPNPPPPPPRPEVSALLSVARTQTRSAATDGELGDLFEYKLKEAITIRKNRSALVPIVQAGVGAEKVSIWNESSGSPRPMRALWLTNTTGLTLDGGSFSVIEQEAFAGEGIFDPIRPGEKRLVSYAVDLALKPGSTTEEEKQRVTRCRLDRGALIRHSEFRQKKAYTFRNQDTSPRTVIVEHPVRTSYELRSAVQPEETTAGYMRFRLKLEPKQTGSLVVDEALPVEDTVEVSSLTDDQVALFLHEKSIDGSVEAALRPVLAQKRVIAGLEKKQSDLEDEQEKIGEAQGRLRENMKALKGSAEEKALLVRYTQQLNQQESRLEAIEREKQALDARLDELQAELARTIEQLAIDVKL